MTEKKGTKKTTGGAKKTQASTEKKGSGKATTPKTAAPKTTEAPKPKAPKKVKRQKHVVHLATILDDNITIIKNVGKLAVPQTFTETGQMQKWIRGTAAGALVENELNKNLGIVKILWTGNIIPQTVFKMD